MPPSQHTAIATPLLHPRHSPHNRAPRTGPDLQGAALRPNPWRTRHQQSGDPAQDTSWSFSYASIMHQSGRIAGAGPPTAALAAPTTCIGHGNLGEPAGPPRRRRHAAPFRPTQSKMSGIVTVDGPAFSG